MVISMVILGATNLKPKLQGGLPWPRSSLQVACDGTILSHEVDVIKTLVPRLPWARMLGGWIKPEMITKARGSEPIPTALLDSGFVNRGTGFDSHIFRNPEL